MNYFIISAYGQDQVGIVSAITTTLMKLACNIEESSMTRLKNEFAILLIVKTTTTIDTIKKELSLVANNKKLIIDVKPLNQAEVLVSQESQAKAILNIYGADQIGIVARITTLLEKYQINIFNLHTNLTNEGLYIMHFDLELSSLFSEDSFLTELAKIKSELKIDANFEKSEVVEL